MKESVKSWYICTSIVLLTNMNSSGFYQTIYCGSHARHGATLKHFISSEIEIYTKYFKTDLK